jgi:uracil-DNA glycosylase
MSPVTTDEIHEKYLQKAIGEINELAHEIAQAAGALRVPVVGTGHPLADIMLVKYRPRATEAQEGVAFYGRSGSALIKSLQRLRVDALAVYGTNCLKFAEGSEDECRPWLVRELHIVQPKLLVVMGDEALEFVNGLEFPLSRPLETTPGKLQQFTPTIEALTTPDIDESLDEQAEKTRFWNSFKLIGSWWAELPPY